MPRTASALPEETLMTQVFAVALITFLAVISPGPDFAMVTRNSYSFGRRAGLLSALGIALGVQVHVAYTMFGVSMFLEHSPGLLLLTKLVGAGYLIHIGIKTALNRTALGFDEPFRRCVSSMEAFKTGFFCNALNPKTMLFVVSTYTQIVRPDTPLLAEFGYGLFISAAHWLWFSLVAIFLTRQTLRTAMLGRQRLFERAIGSILIALGVMLAGSNLGT
jgi:threonine/homoserine/homoserine lactone efflux protein